MLRWLVVLLVPSYIFSTSCLASEFPLTRIQLISGAIIEAPLLAKKHDRLLFDLGHDVVSIPLNRIVSTTNITSQQLPTQEQDTSRLYITHQTPPPIRSIKVNAKNSSEAVLRVRTPTGLGSGFLIHPDGYVVTNHHVINGEHEIALTLFENGPNELRPILFNQIRIVALSAHLDLALLKIENLGTRKLPTLPLGRSEVLEQGDEIFSIGSPLGFDRTVSQGIISHKNRQVNGQLYLQSTTQINPGNSGGPLFNLQGEVIGVNNMKIQSIGIEGLSFAIPANRLQVFLDNVDAYAFDVRNSNNGFIYNRPPTSVSTIKINHH